MTLRQNSNPGLLKGLSFYVLWEGCKHRKKGFLSKDTVGNFYFRVGVGEVPSTSAGCSVASRVFRQTLKHMPSWAPAATPLSNG